MDIKQKVILGIQCIRTLMFNKRKPIFISWAITARCNLRCEFCNIWQRQLTELKTGEVIKVIESFAKMGTKIIRFTGGEPLLRDDMPEIINYSRGLDILVTISTNGVLFPEKIKEIKRLDGVSLSLEGPEGIHDAIRGLGTYRKAMEALETAKKKNIPISIATTLTSLNLDSVQALFHIARYFKARIFFQPATQIVLYGEEPNPSSPDVNQYRAVILSLLKSKTKNRFIIGNSTAALKHLYNWPNKTAINCVAGKVICQLDPQGNLNPCSRFAMKNNGLNVIDKGVRHCFNQLYAPSCGNCWCSSLVELNLLSGYKLSAFSNAIKF